MLDGLPNDRRAPIPRATADSSLIDHFCGERLVLADRLLASEGAVEPIGLGQNLEALRRAAIGGAKVPCGDLIKRR